MGTQQAWAQPKPGTVCLLCREDRGTTVPMTVLSLANRPTIEMFSMWRRITGKAFPVTVACIPAALCYECLAEMRRTAAAIEKFTKLASLWETNECRSPANLLYGQTTCTAKARFNSANGSDKAQTEANANPTNANRNSSDRIRDENQLTETDANSLIPNSQPGTCAKPASTTQESKPTIANVEEAIEWLDFSESDDDASDYWPADCSADEETSTASESQREERKLERHDPLEPFVCHLCGERLAGKVQWRNHLQRAHDSNSGYMNKPPIEYQFTTGAMKRKLIYTPREQQLFKCIQSMSHYCRYKCLNDNCNVMVLLLHNGELRGLTGEHNGHGSQEEVYESFKAAQKRRDAKQKKNDKLHKAQSATQSQRSTTTTTASIEHVLTPSRLVYTTSEKQLYRPTVTMPDHVRYCCVVFQCRSTMRLMSDGQLVQSRRVRHSHRNSLEAIYHQVRDVRSKTILQTVAKALDEQDRKARERDSGRRDRKAVVILKRRTRGQRQSKRHT